jgi:CDP-paratose synthetase
VKILITGASGFLGSSLAMGMAGFDNQVALLVRRTSSLHRIANLNQFRIGRCENDFEIKMFIHEFSPDVVIHTACCFGKTDESILEIFNANLYFGVSVLNFLGELRKKVHFINVDTVLNRSGSLYALTKSQFSEIGYQICSNPNQNIQFNNIRLQYLYGPGDYHHKFTSNVIRACKNNYEKLPLTIGIQKRDFIYMDDAVTAFIKIVKNLPSLKNCSAIDLGSGKTISIRNFAEIAHKVSNSTTRLLFGELPMREREDMNLVANISFLRELGWVPIFDVEAGIKKILEMDY